MKRWLPAVVLAATLTWAVPTLAQNTAAAAKGTPAPIILAKDHPMHGTVFSSRLNKSSYWRAEVQRKGYDAAFADWLLREHPDVYRKHFGLAKPDPSMNDKQMNRGMKM